jgi:tRNA A-37 threonylcarbamoyl transferase component Bud32
MQIYRLHRGARTGCAVADVSHAALIRLTDYPELPLRTSTQDVVKAGQTALIVRTELEVAGQPLPVAYKRVRRKNWWKVLTSLVRPNGVLRAWRMGHILMARGIATARPLAAIVPRRPWRDRDAYVATEWVVGAENLDAFCRGQEAQARDESRRTVAATAAALGRLIGRLHAERISHRDLKAGNLLVREAADGIEVFLIDLDGATFRRRLSRRLRLKNLARLAVAVEPYCCVRLTTRLRFLKSYCAEVRAQTSWCAEWRELARLAAASSARRRRQKIRKAA